jgi:hypothetical protein
LEKVVAASGAAVAVKVTGDPVAPLRVALAAWAPDPVPRVHEVLAIPFASVVEDAGLSEPLAALVLHATVEVEEGTPFSVTNTRSGVGKS